MTRVLVLSLLSALLGGCVTVPAASVSYSDGYYYRHGYYRDYGYYPGYAYGYGYRYRGLNNDHGQ